MAQRSRSTLKSYFQTADRPTSSQFGDAIDTFALQAALDMINLSNSTLVTRANGGELSNSITIDVDSTGGFEASDKVGYVRTDGVYEQRSVTVNSATQFGVAAIGGGIADNAVIALVPPIFQSIAEIGKYGGSVTDPNAVQAMDWARGGIYNVMSYGATGDGTTDDTAAIQAAVDDARPNQGEVYFPRGSYKVTSTISNVANEIVLRGAGRMVTKIQIDPAFSGPIFTDAGANQSWLHIRDMTIRSVGGKATGAIFYHAVGACLEGHFTNLHINNIGVAFKGIFQDCKWLHCKIIALDFAGFWFTGTQVRQGYLNGLDVEGGLLGIYIDESAGFQELYLNNVKFESTLAGIYRNCDYISEAQCSSGPSTRPPLINESVSRYDGSIGDKVRRALPTDLNDIEFPNWITDGDMGLAGISAWTGSNTTLTKIGESHTNQYLIGPERKHPKMLEVLSTAIGGYVEQTVSAVSGRYYFFTCLYAVENGNNITVEVVDNAANVLMRKQAIAGSDPYVPKFRRLSGAFDAGAASTITVRFYSNNNGAKIWLNEVVLCENLIRREGFALFGDTANATLTTADTGDFYTEPSSLLLSKTVTDRRVIRSHMGVGAVMNNNEEYLVWVRGKVPTDSDPNLRVFLSDPSVVLLQPSMILPARVGGWIEMASVINGATSTSEYLYVHSMETIAGDIRLDATAVVPLGSKRATRLYPTYRKGKDQGGYRIEYGPEIDISAANSSQLLFYPTEHYQLHKVELIYTVAPDNTNAANLKIGLTGDDDYYVLENVQGTQTQWATRELVPLKSDVRRDTPIMVDWVQNASQTATVIPVLYLK